MLATRYGVAGGRLNRGAVFGRLDGGRWGIFEMAGE